MNTSLIFSFLEQLAEHNYRPWFNAHKDEYLAARDAFEQLVNLLILRIGEFDPAVRALAARDCMYRIYRDTRFSMDKTPYKTHLGAYINARGKKEWHHCGYYIHLEPGHSMLAGGCFPMNGKVSHAIREAIVENIDEYRRIVEDPSFRRFFPTIGTEFLKTIPRGFPKDFAYPRYLQCKDFVVSYEVGDDFFKRADFVDTLVEACRTAKPFFDFLDYTTDNL